MYAIHMDDATIRCNSCYNSNSYKLFQMQRLREDYSSIQVTRTMNGKSMQLTIPIPRLPRNGSLDSFMAEINASFKQEAAKGSKQGVQRLKSKLDAVLARAINEPLGCFGLDLVHAMVRQLDFVNKICSNYDYWCQPHVIDESIRRYHQFIHLMHIQSAGTLVPTSDIDIVWHHQTLPIEYAVFCNDIVGQLIDHDDTIPGGTLTTASRKLVAPASLSDIGIDWHTNKTMLSDYRLSCEQCRAVNDDEFADGGCNSHSTSTFKIWTSMSNPIRRSNCRRVSLPFLRPPVHMCIN
ncbi:Aste57867_20322 [Aphanomyces stellatus]|uniref:Aste57867_20322 protein n=1 Tax=Aphanomyces stellatus TaxID=120398 RepID=A0A485KD42_9STRA|nr:hypothetical protein As57867_020256 [Aphanomyces stellatus]KAF0715692.1 hypothetical protein As57867_003234 [Aphanomyces stellatus]VFT80417.1 Aste57867_3244 [Aphanomyces stellatus]VFT97010.1 Aste57867_20322 [Aphanomyces stellatus]